MHTKKLVIGVVLGTFFIVCFVLYVMLSGSASNKITSDMPFFTQNQEEDVTDVSLPTNPIDSEVDDPLAAKNDSDDLDGNRVSKSPFEGKTFVWIKTVEKSGAVITPQKKDSFTLSVSGGNVSGTTDCNSYGGKVTVDESHFTVTTSLVMTMMYCEGSQESEFVQALGKIVTYRFSGESLILSGGTDGPEMWFAEKNTTMEPLPPVRVGEPGIDTPQVVGDGCMVGGCSGQLCGDGMLKSDLITTCEYRPEYACYQSATCERQRDGQCGWTTTPKLTQCLQAAGGESL